VIETEKELCKEYDISERLLEVWLEHFKNDSVIQEY